MSITKDKMVSLTYDLRLNGSEGELIEQATEEKPLRFVYGAGMMLPSFEAKLEGLVQGNPFNISLSSKEAYGEVNENAFVDLPKHIFHVDGKFDTDLIREGNTVPMMSAGGQRLNGLVLEISGESVKMDFNHPLAGENLFFSGEVLEVRNATDEEMTALAGDCGCGSGACSCGEGGNKDDCGCEGKGHAPGGSCGCGH
ncbi:MAG: peptidylprolyl isomerase [Mangrovibacterium sp.]